MEEANSEEEQANLGTYDSVLEDGIFNMVITLCQHKANSIGLDNAKAEVADWLDKLSNGLRQTQES